MDNSTLDTLRATFELSSTLDTSQILILSVVLVALSSLLATVYYFTGNSLSNRLRLAAVLPLMSLTTMLIIAIIQSSLALSLGLVGALSIVRFRSAIKDPEELAYIFLSIALGLGFGANQATLTMLFFLIIVIVILGQAGLRRYLRGPFSERDAVNLELVFSNPQSLRDVTAILDKHCRFVKLNRLQDDEPYLMLFLVKPKNAADLEALRSDLRKLDNKLKLTLLDYQPLV